MPHSVLAPSSPDGRGYHALRRITRALDVHSRRLYREWKITSPQFLCLQALEKESVRTLSQLAAELHLGASTVNGILDRLEARGLVSRSRSQEDQRKVLLSVTPEGQALVDSVPELMRDSYARALGRMSLDEQEQLSRLLGRLADHLDPEIVHL
ncbi:MarR family transcriptional regulator [Chlorobium sp. N1]|uniref:MarR family winged helix-turn-helix transcriptional regulator n=1 Tax=Chlorobium sp. N1 TaxID=2491138 RepID=UPI001040BBCC|nr:MarR family transcriptional regulator [Chlorobium sp. N1]TCD48706.1 MarR family transcriptional regulator [Chlorobium sp. N1]